MRETRAGTKVGSPELTCLHFNFVLFGAKLIVDCVNVLSVHLLAAGLLRQNPLRGFSPQQRQQRSYEILLRDVSLLLDFLCGRNISHLTAGERIYIQLLP